MTSKDFALTLLDIIKIGSRFTKDLGDITFFANISRVGLLHSIAVKPEQKLIVNQEESGRSQRGFR